MATTKPGLAADRFRRSADEQARLAAATPLPRVRERCLEAERSFRAMAERAEAVALDMRERAAAVVARPSMTRPNRFGHT